MQHWIVSVVVFLLVFFLGYWFGGYAYINLHFMGVIEVSPKAPSEDEKFMLDLKCDTWEELAQKRMILLKVRRKK